MDKKENKQEFEGLWANTTKNNSTYYSSRYMTVDEIAEKVGANKFKIIMIENKFYEEGSSKPKFSFKIKVQTPEQENATQNNTQNFFYEDEPNW